MKKSLSALFALAFTLMFGLVHVASAMKHEGPAGAPAAEAKKEMTKEEKKEVKKEKKMKKKAAKKDMKKEEMKGTTPAAPAK